MKILLKILSLIFIACTFVATAQPNCNNLPQCYQTENPCDCQAWSNWAVKIERIILPEFPTCTLSIYICYRECLTNYLCTEHYISDWGIEAACWTACTEFMTWFNSGSDAERARRARALRLRFWEIICDSWWQQFVVERGADYLKCKDGIRKKYYLTDGICYAICYTQYPISDPNLSFLVTTHTCYDGYCCKHWIEYFINDDGTTRKEKHMESTGTMNCYELHFPEQGCPPGANVDVDDCMDACFQDP